VVLSVADLTLDPLSHRVSRGGRADRPDAEGIRDPRDTAPVRGQPSAERGSPRGCGRRARLARHLVDVHMSHLRRKIDAPGRPPLIPHDPREVVSCSGHPDDPASQSQGASRPAAGGAAGLILGAGIAGANWSSHGWCSDSSIRRCWSFSKTEASAVLAGRRDAHVHEMAPALVLRRFHAWTSSYRLWIWRAGWWRGVPIWAPSPASSPGLLEQLRSGEQVLETLHDFGDEPVRMLSAPIKVGTATYAIQVAGSLDDASAAFIRPACSSSSRPPPFSCGRSGGRAPRMGHPPPDRPGSWAAPE